jgi:hypothetical protein
LGIGGTSSDPRTFGPKIQREEEDDIPRASLRGGTGDVKWTGATGANAMEVGRGKVEWS